MDQVRRKLEAIKYRRQQQSLGRPIVASAVSGTTVVAVGKRIYSSPKWKTFHDFLREYLVGSLGKDWSEAELRKPLDRRNPILRWYGLAIETAKKLATEERKMISGPMTGAIRAYLNLSYNIYLIAHHGSQEMADVYLKRLKSRRLDDFTGALFETYAAATFIKAGFKLQYEELRRRATSTVEFVATWPETGEKFSVEVKSRNYGDAPAKTDADGKSLRVGSKLIKALQKSAAHTRVVMIEINVPDELDPGDPLEGWPTHALRQIRGNEDATQRDGSLYPPAYVLVTNHQFHHDLDGNGTGFQAIAAGFRMDDFGPDVLYKGYAAVMASRDRHAAMNALISSLKTRSEIPATFDGELPSSLAPERKRPRLQYGQHYEIGGEGGKIAGRFVNATVNEETGEVLADFERADGSQVLATMFLGAEELEEYRSYPDTYFGAVMQQGSRSETYVDFCDFLFASYQETPREKLLELLLKAPDYEVLKDLPRRDLAIAYADRIAATFFKDKPTDPRYAAFEERLKARESAAVGDDASCELRSSQKAADNLPRRPTMF